MKPWSWILSAVLALCIAQSALAATVIRGPYLQMGADDFVVVRWRTDLAVPSEVQFGSSEGVLDRSASDLALKTEHEMLVDVLDPDTQYWYAISDGSTVMTGGDANTWFKTAPAPGTPRPMRIWVLGDSGLQGPDQLAVRDAYLAATGDRATDLVLMLGDNAYADGTDLEHQYELFIPYAEVLRNAVLWPARGNHDVIHPGEDNDYFEFFTLPTGGECGGVASGTESWFSFDVGNVHFICFDSYQGDLTPPSAMLDWIAADLAANELEWTIAFTHYSPYTKGSHDSDLQWASIQLREQFVPVLEAGGVDLVLTGHSHGYERSYLIDGHYGDSTTFTSVHQVDAGDGDPLGDGEYFKPSRAPAPHEGTVYCVAGSASRTNTGVFGHPAMVTGGEVLGSVALEIDGNVLTAEFITSTGEVGDQFSIVKGGDVAAPSVVAGGLPVVAPNPFSTSTTIQFALMRPGSYTVDVYDLAGRRVRSLSGDAPSGPVTVSFDGRDSAGREMASGTYLYQVRADGVVRTGRMSLVR